MDLLPAISLPREKKESIALELNYFNIDRYRKKHNCAQRKDMIVTTLVQVLKKVKENRAEQLVPVRVN